MMQSVGLDVSMRETKLHVLDEAGQRVWRGRCATEPAAIAAAVHPIGKPSAVSAVQSHDGCSFRMLMLKRPSSIRVAPSHPSSAPAITAMFCNQVPERKACFLLACLFVLLANAISIRRRIASEREGLSFCCLAQFSIANLVLGANRTVRTGSGQVHAAMVVLGTAEKYMPQASNFFGELRPAASHTHYLWVSLAAGICIGARPGRRRSRRRTRRHRPCTTKVGGSSWRLRPSFRPSRSCCDTDPGPIRG